jgi:glycosyltransferase involved in cell wall biosynthesis
MSKRRLLIVSIWDRMWSLEGAAGVSDDYHFVRGLTAAGWDIHFLAPASTDPDDPFPGATVHTYPNFFRATRALPVPARRLLWMPLFDAIAAPRALRLVRSLGPDVILGHTHYSARTVSRARSLGVPSALKLFGVMDLVHAEWPRLKYRYKNAEQLSALRHPQDAWIVLDDGTRGGEILRGLGLPPEKVHFLPNGLNLEWQDATDEGALVRHDLHIPEGAPVVLFLARLVASKRPEDVLRAAPGVLRDQPDTVFVFAGDGELRGRCEALARQLGIEASARFAGTVPHAQVPRLMSAADVFVTTSSLTNMALPTCEALICGVPVVAYDTGDTARVVRPGETGTLVLDGDADALSSAIATLLSDATLRERMSSAARALAREAFTGWEERVEMERALLDGLAAKGVTP